jgi:hemolysin-activating ACP:hemolysin acyltransferase
MIILALSRRLSPKIYSTQKKIFAAHHKQITWDCWVLIITNTNKTIQEKMIRTRMQNYAE